MWDLRHKTFIGPTVYWHGYTLNQNREAIRAEAEAFVNLVGVESVVSIAEHAMSFGPFSVVVWYRAGSSTPVDEPVAAVSNAAIARRLRGGPAADPGVAAGGWVLWLVVCLSAALVLGAILPWLSRVGYY